MAIEGIDHIDLVVRDPEAMSAWLQRLGFMLVRYTADGRGSIELRVPGPGDQPIIELTPIADANGKERPLGLRHIAYRGMDLAALLDALAQDGLTPKGEARVVPATGRRLVNYIDPEGGTVQIVDAG